MESDLREPKFEQICHSGIPSLRIPPAALLHIQHHRRPMTASTENSALFWQFPELELPAPSWLPTVSGLPRWPLSFIPPSHLRLPDFEYDLACDGAPFVPLTREEAMTVHLSARRRNLPTGSGAGVLGRPGAAEPTPGFVPGYKALSDRSGARSPLRLGFACNAEDFVGQQGL